MNIFSKQNSMLMSHYKPDRNSIKTNSVYCFYKLSNNYFEILGAEGGATAVIDEAAFDEDLFEDEDLDDLEDELNNLEV